MLTGDVAIQISVPRKTMQPSVRLTVRSRTWPSLVRSAGEEERDREEDDAEDVVGRTLDVPANGRGGDLGLGVQSPRLGRRGELVLRHRERRQRRLRVLERLRGEPGDDGGPELLAEALEVEVGQLGPLQGVGVDPLDERRHVDLRLRFGEPLGARRLDPDRVRPARRLRLLAVPARRLVAAPCRRNRRERQQHGRDDLGVLPVWTAAQRASPAALHGSGLRMPTRTRSWARMRQRALHRDGLQRSDSRRSRGCRGTRAGAASPRPPRRRSRSAAPASSPARRCLRRRA